MTAQLRNLVRRAAALAFVAGLALATSAAAQPSFLAFESGPVRPLALSPNGALLFVVNTPDNTLEIFSNAAAGPVHLGSVPVGMEPVAVAARTDDEVWVVNHLSDSVSVIDVPTWRVVRTLLVGDEPRDIVITDPDGGGVLGDRVFVTTAHRGQHRTHSSLDPVNNLGSDDGDPQLTTPSVPRADVWVFDATAPGSTIGGTPLGVVELFGDTPRALAVSNDGTKVYAAVFHSGNQTAVAPEGIVCDGFGTQNCNGDGVMIPGGLNGGKLPGGNPGPATNHALEDAPETGLIVKFDNVQNRWEDENGENWHNGIRFHLPDHDVFEIDAATLAAGTDHEHVGTILFNMAVNPVSGNVYVSNTESNNLTRFEGAGVFGGSTVQGNLSRARITVLDSGAVNPRHLNKHIDYGTLALLPNGSPNPAFDLTQKNHSLATPTDMVVSSDGATLYVAAFSSSKVGVFDTATLENDSFDPTVESANYISVSGGGPGGLALDESRNRLYVLTRFDNSLSVVNTATGAEVNHIPLHNPEPETVTAGRHMLYDANKTSGNGEASCSSCHVFGDFDSLSWDLGDPDGDVVVNPQPINFAAILPLFPGGVPAGINGTGNIDDIHPMKGPMTTQTLRGMVNSGHMHWRGDRSVGFFGTDSPHSNDSRLSFKNFIVAFPGLVGGDTLPTDANLQADMDLFADFMLEVVLPPNPVRALDNSLTPDQNAGRTYYFGNAPGSILSDGSSFFPGATGFTCDGCHTLDPGNGFFGTGGNASFENEPQIIKIAHLRNLYQKVGMFGMPNVPFNNNTDSSHQGDQVRGTGFLHDGSTDTIFRFFQATVFNNPSIFDGSPDVGFIGGNPQRRDVEEFMLAFDTDLAPMVGQQVTLNASSPTDTTDRLDDMETAATTSFNSLLVNVQPGNTPVTECDLVAKGIVSGDARGYFYDPGGAGGWVSDRVGEPAISSAALRSLATIAGQELTFTCVPPGSGPRLALDRDEDGSFDRDELDSGTNPANAGSFLGACSDGQDNDGDGLSDLLDPGCKDGASNIENPACDDGYDNDNDGAADGADVHCSVPYRNRETGNKCGLLGFEPFAALGLMRVLRRRRNR